MKCCVKRMYLHILDNSALTTPSRLFLPLSLLFFLSLNLTYLDDVKSIAVSSDSSHPPSTKSRKDGRDINCADCRRSFSGPGPEIGNAAGGLVLRSWLTVV